MLGSRHSRVCLKVFIGTTLKNGWEMTRLVLVAECETEEPPLDTSQMAKMLQILLKDVVTLKKMASFSWGS